MSFFEQINQLENQGREVALCIVTKSQGSTPRRAGSKMLVFPDGRIEGTIGGGEMENRVIAEALQALAENKPRTLTYTLSDPASGDPGVCGGQMEVYVEPIKPHPTVVVVGVGHVGKAVAELAHWLGFRVAVSDDRPDFINVDELPAIDEVHAGPLADLPQQVSINDQTYLVLTTRNVEIDVAGLPSLLETPAAYIGVIGSRRRWATTRKILIEAGISEEKLDRVVSPMGIELNAETPTEIALSILAEIIMLRRDGDGERMAG